jgi:threonine aldolase
VADLAHDHRRAARLAEGLAAFSAIEVTSQATNMVFVRIDPAHVAPLAKWLKANGVLIELLYATRMVVHRDISDDDIEQVLTIVQRYFDQA